MIIKEAKNGKYALNFESGSLEKLVLERKGGGILELMVKGIPAHSGVAPEKRERSAILEMAHKIVEIENKNNIIEGKTY